LSSKGGIQAEWPVLAFVQLSNLLLSPAAARPPLRRFRTTYRTPSSRGLGIGTLALRLLQNVCRDLGARSLALEVGLDNVGAEALYRREGFSTTGRQLMTRRL